ncbi:MAG: hypothetical protein V8S03_04555 [Faecalimonas umbilicata]|uniref:hypothetical protein n=1 Tax=Faecalimonas umbilicata TaxID=1912855 RepID=UPI00300F5E9F
MTGRQCHEEKNKSCFDNFLFVIAFFVEINVEARSVRNMSAYPAKHGQSFVQSVWMEQKEVFDASLYRAVLCTKDMKQKKSNEGSFLQQYIPLQQWLTGVLLWSMCSVWVIPDIIGVQKRKVWYHQTRMEIIHLGDGKSRIPMNR